VKILVQAERGKKCRSEAVEQSIKTKQKIFSQEIPKGQEC
jgi:hypothetical protein